MERNHSEVEELVGELGDGMSAIYDPGSTPDILVKAQLADLISKSFRDLLEHKHLYQNYTIQQDAIGASLRELVEKQSKGTAQNMSKLYTYLLNNRWNIADPASRRPISRIAGDPEASKLWIGHLSTIKVLCTACDRVEAFNPVYATDLLKDSEYNSNDAIIQVFAFAYQCQACKGVPEFFLIRRNGLKLIVSGRSPMEKVAVPSYIPKWVRVYYSNSLVAYNSGQTLAALFFLRTLVEQYVRGPNKMEGYVNDLIAKYMDTLPVDFKNRFPSLWQIYQELSDAIHAARDSTEIFEESIKGIDRHFDAKRVYEIAESTS